MTLLGVFVAAVAAPEAGSTELATGDETPTAMVEEEEEDVEPKSVDDGGKAGKAFDGGNDGNALRGGALVVVATGLGAEGAAATGGDGGSAEGGTAAVDAEIEDGRGRDVRLGVDESCAIGDVNDDEDEEGVEADARMTAYGARKEYNATSLRNSTPSPPPKNTHTHTHDTK